jgi:alkylmercury lyase-like protein
MDEQDVALRNRTYELLVELGRPPSAGEVGLPVEDVRAGWRRLHDAHAIVLDPAGEIRMANPFSAVATAYRVEAGGRSWYGSCAWDAFGICAALESDGVVETSCPDCGDAITVEVSARRADRDDLLFHCLVPAAHWWDDIVFT